MPVTRNIGTGPGSQLAVWSAFGTAQVVEVLDVPDWMDPEHGLFVRFVDDGEEFWVDVRHVTPIGQTAHELLKVRR